MAGYGTDDGFADWLAGNGHSLPGSAPSSAVLRQRASDYLDALYGAQFRGYPTGGVDQERAWPRTDATAWGQALAADVIPPAVIRASYAGAWHEATNPGSLAVASSASTAIKREKIDVIETEYFGGTGNALADATVRISEVDGLLKPFLKGEAANGPMVMVV